jgi:heterodisulfide reductase subunit A2
MRKNYAALVVGSGVGGIRAALDLAETGQKVALIDKRPHMGGLLAQIDQQFPSDHCGMCKMLPLTERDASSQFCMRKGLFHKNIDTFLSTSVTAMEGEPGKFQATLTRQIPIVDPTRCIGCGVCSEACPIEVPNEFNAGLGTRTAAYLPVPHNIPNHFVVDLENCTLCRKCVDVCPTQAIDFRSKEREDFPIFVVTSNPQTLSKFEKWFSNQSFPLYSADNGTEAVEILAKVPSLRLLFIEPGLADLSAQRVVARALELHPELYVVCLKGEDGAATDRLPAAGAQEVISNDDDRDLFWQWFEKRYLKTVCREKIDIEIAAVILAGGFELYDPSEQEGVLGYGRHPRVMTNLAFERMLSGTGPLPQKINAPLTHPLDHKQIRKIAWLQCVGSRDHQRNADYCSSVCCMISIKEALQAKRISNGAVDTAIFYMDMRSFGKNYQRYRDAAEKEMGVRFVPSRVHTVNVNESQPDDRPEIRVDYVDPDGNRVEEAFDLVVLATGARAPSEVRELADVTGIELNTWGFPVTRPFAPTHTSQLGVFAAGAFAAPRDITETVITANAAALEASRIINIYAPLKEQVPAAQPQYRDVAKEAPKQLIALCTSCPILEKRADISVIAKKLDALDGVSTVIEIKRACTKDGWEEIQKKATQDKPNRILLGACMPYAYVPRLRELAETLNLNPAMMDVVDIYSPTVRSTTSKDKALIEREIFSTLSMASVKLMGADPSPLPTPVQVVPEALVIGGGLAGMTAAMGIADHGYGVCLVEESENLGGMAMRLRTTLSGDDPIKYMNDLIEQVRKHPHIRVFTDARVSLSMGRAGRFMSMISTDEGSMALEHGVTVIATGGREAKNYVYGYPSKPSVLTQLELEEKLATGKLDAGALNSVAMIQCVGSREEPRNYCSRVCCAGAIKNILTLKKRNPDIGLYVFYRDIMTYGFGESYFTQARKAGAVFIRYEKERKPEVSFEEKMPVINAWDPILRQFVEVRPNLLVLSNGIEPSDARDVAELLGVGTDGDGFFQEAESKWRPVEFLKHGIFVCGVAQAPGSMPETIASAKAAAQRALRVLSEKRLVSSPVVAEVRHTLCTQCGRCIEVCPYEARSLDPVHDKIVVDELLCQGCGSCAAICPNSASTLRGFRDDQILSVIDAALKEYV